MSRSHKLSSKEQNGSLTSEPDGAMSNLSPPLPAPSTSRGKKSVTHETKNNSFSQRGHAPDTSTPIREDDTGQRKQHSKKSGPSGLNPVRRNLEADLASCQPSAVAAHASTGPSSPPFPAVDPSTALSPALSPAVSSIAPDDSTYGMSPPISKRGFVSEFENGTIQAQRTELQLLMAELRDRDRELDDMVKSHHRQLLGWEEDRQRVLSLQQRNDQLQAELQRKSKQVHALVARIKTSESKERATSGSLQSVKAKFDLVSEHLQETKSKLSNSEDKCRQLGSMVKELSTALGKLEVKEREMLAMLTMKDKDLASASADVTELRARLQSKEAEVKQHMEVENKAHTELAQWKHKYLECKREVEKLMVDLNRSQQEEEESRIERDRTLREQQQLRKKLILMAEREKRYEGLIASQRQKQERTDTELASLRQLYERQQREISLLYLNLESTKDLLAKQKESSNTDQYGNVSFLLQSPTPVQHAAYHPKEDVSLHGNDTASAPHAHVTAGSNSESGTAPGSSSSTDLAAVGTGHHATGSAASGAGQLRFESTANDEVIHEVHRTDVTRQQAWSGRSGIPVKTAAVNNIGVKKVTPKQAGHHPAVHKRGGSPVREETVAGKHSVKQQIPNQTLQVEDLKESQPHPRLSPVHQTKLPQQQQGQVQASSQQYDQEQQCESLLDESPVYEAQEDLLNQRSSTSGDRDPPNPAVIASSTDALRQSQGSVSVSGSDIFEINDFSTPPRHQRPRSKDTSLLRNAADMNTGATPEVSPPHVATPEIQEPAANLDDSLIIDYPEQTGFSSVGEIDIQRTPPFSNDTADEDDDPSPITQAQRQYGVQSSSAFLRTSHTDSDIVESPTSKLHRLLTESRQMVQSLERSTYPPFFSEEPVSPIKAEEDLEQH